MRDLTTHKALASNRQGTGKEREGNIKGTGKARLFDKQTTRRN